MPWSTRELAALASTTVNTVRYYHRVGLLAEPDREENGYKQYSAQHLARLLRLRRLSALGIPLARIAEVSAGDERSPEVLRELDAELAENIERMQQARTDIAVLLRESAPADTPVGFESVAAHLSEADSSLLHIFGQIFDEQSLADMREMVEGDTDGIGDELGSLPADADEPTRAALTERMTASVVRSLTEYPWMRDPRERLTRHDALALEGFISSVRDLYNEAQLDVLQRVSLQLQPRLIALAEAERGTSDAPR